MWPLPRPRQSARDTYLTCIGKARPDKQKILNQYVADVDSAARRFDLAARAAELHALNAAEFGPSRQCDAGHEECDGDRAEQGCVHAKELTKVYTDRMAGKRSPGRAVYDALCSAAPYGRCPLCGQRQVGTLDHHLPKSSYPFLAVAPTNLVPCCFDCNHTKKDSAPASESEQTLHPYFDNIDDHRWLRARLIEKDPASLNFYVAPAGTWPAKLTERVQSHFSLLNLNGLYSAQAAGELTEISPHISQLIPHGSGCVREYLLEVADSRAATRRNGWTTATYYALAESDWFCSGRAIS